MESLTGTTNPQHLNMSRCT